jgi:hypothetical protein
MGASGTTVTTTTAKELLDKAVEAKGLYQSNRGNLTRLFFSIIEQISHHSHAIDVFSQVEPNVSAVVWGSLCLVLQVRLSHAKECHISIGDHAYQSNFPYSI